MCVWEGEGRGVMCVCVCVWGGGERGVVCAYVWVKYSINSQIVSVAILEGPNG